MYILHASNYETPRTKVRVYGARALGHLASAPEFVTLIQQVRTFLALLVEKYK